MQLSKRTSRHGALLSAVAPKRAIGFVLMVALVSSLGMSTASANVPIIIPVSQAAATYIVAGDQYFGNSIGGLRAYIDSIKAADPDLYAKLDLRVSEHYDAAVLSMTSYVVGSAVGGGLIIAAPFFLGGCHLDDLIDDVTEKLRDFAACGDRKTATFLSIMGAGFGVAVTGFVVGFMVAPKETVLDLINAHNRLRPGSPLRLRVRIEPSKKAYYAALSFDF